jgi:hypothetical protein
MELLKKTFNITQIDIHDYKYSRIIQHLLAINGWKSESGNHTKATYSNKNSLSTIKTYLDGTEMIFLKHKLAANYPEFVPESVSIEKEDDLIKIPVYALETGIWFVKPSNMLIGSGEGITIIQIAKNEQFRERVRKIIREHKGAYVIQKNISNPLLRNGKKFDMRVHGVIVFTPTHIASYLFSLGILRYALRKFSNSEDKFAMMTNISLYKRLPQSEIDKLASDKSNLTELVDFISNTEFSRYFVKLQKMFAKIIHKMSSKIKNRNEDYGFIIIGLDVIVTDTGDVKILEINQHPTLYDDSSSLESAYNYPFYFDSNKYFFEEFYDLVFDSLIHNKLKNTDTKYWKIANFDRFV